MILKSVQVSLNLNKFIFPEFLYCKLNVKIIKNLINVTCDDTVLKHLFVVIVDVSVHDKVADQLKDLQQDQAGQVHLHHIVFIDDLLSIMKS